MLPDWDLEDPSGKELCLLLNVVHPLQFKHLLQKVALYTLVLLTLDCLVQHLLSNGIVEQALLESLWAE